MPVDHYENFPVASYALPARYRGPVALIYRFARTADDYADEADIPAEERLRLLGAYSAALHDIEAGRAPSIAWFSELAGVIREHALPLQPFHDLLSAFAQDVTCTRYSSRADLLDYCRRSANPVGRLLIALYRADTADNRRYSDAICTALQLVNFLQDVAIDYRKGRIYLPLEELERHGICAEEIGVAPRDIRWSRFMAEQVSTTRALLLSGTPLGRAMRGRLGLEMRMIIAGAARILDKIAAADGDVFRARPVLKWRDWPLIAIDGLRR